MTDTSARSLLITGAYGTGKTTLAAELAEQLAARQIPCAAIDLDWLGCFWLPGDRPHGVNDLVVANLRGVVANYAAAGITHLVVPGTIRTQVELGALRPVLPEPLAVLQLTVPLPEIERRLRADVTAGRLDDLAVSATEPDAGGAIADLRLGNEGPIAELAQRVLDWLDWR